MTQAKVILWGREIGALRWDAARALGSFEYAAPFIGAGFEPAPFTMPVRVGVYDFPGLPRESFKGLPGMLADSLPDKFGNLLIDRWLAEQGRTADSFDPVERLCYIGKRGMGALEFEPAQGPGDGKDALLEIGKLVELASRVIAERAALGGNLTGSRQDAHALRDILRVGASAGGARAKAVLAWHPASGEFRSGQLPAGSGFEPWMLKFDGVTGNADKEVADPTGYGRLEYACYLLARDAGIEMMESRLHEEGGRAHFMTRRFDRTPDGHKLHMQSLAALRHYDFNQPRAYAYEQAIETIRRLGLPRPALEQQLRRALLNVVIRNQDDHVKNIAFLMDKAGRWRLAPAFDVVYAYNPAGAWTSQHQMTMNGKADGFTLDDLLALGRYADFKPAQTKALLAEILAAAAKWEDYAARAALPPDMARRAHNGFRLDFLG